MDTYRVNNLLAAGLRVLPDDHTLERHLFSNEWTYIRLESSRAETHDDETNEETC